MLWLLLLLASGSYGDTDDAITTASAPSRSTLSVLEEAVTKNLLSFKNEVTERNDRIVENASTVAGHATDRHGPTAELPSSVDLMTARSDVGSDHSSLTLSKKTDLNNVPLTPVGPPVNVRCSYEEWDSCSSDEDLADAFVEEARFLANHYVVEVPIYSLANATTEFIKSREFIC